MEKVKIVLLSLIIGFSSMAQESIVKEGLLRAQLTISPSTMLSGNESYFYLHGNLEGYVSNKISISGEGYYLLGNIKVPSIYDFPLSRNHNVFFGANYHFTKNNHDFYLGIQPGVAFTNVSFVFSDFSKPYINPVFSSVVGYNYYINNIFHFFVQTRLILGKHLANDVKSLNEIRFSAGLGFNFGTK
ncbi:MAG: hypothetical protein ACLGGV_02365 [Bacteroidia bacterium]